MAAAIRNPAAGSSSSPTAPDRRHPRAAEAGPRSVAWVSPDRSVTRSTASAALKLGLGGRAEAIVGDTEPRDRIGEDQAIGKDGRVPPDLHLVRDGGEMPRGMLLEGRPEAGELHPGVNEDPGLAIGARRREATADRDDPRRVRGGFSTRLLVKTGKP